MDSVIRDEKSHNEKRAAILEALGFEEALATTRQEALKSFNRGGPEEAEEYFYIPKDARRLLHGYSKSELADILTEGERLGVGVMIGAKPCKLKRGWYIVRVC